MAKILFAKRRTILLVIVLISGTIVFLLGFSTILDGQTSLDFETVDTNEGGADTFKTMRKMKNLLKKNREMSLMTMFKKSKMREADVRHKAPNVSPSVIILTYMRSGSSVTGDILQRHKDVFYIFEPIYAVEKAERENQSITFLDGTIFAPGTYNRTEVYMRDIKGWLTCNFKLITVHSLFNNFLRFGRKTESTINCLHSEKQFLVDCLSELEAMCRKSKTKIVKTLRINMAMGKQLLEEIPNSKMIHLSRDPRATLLSKKRIYADCRNSFTGENGCSKLHCDSVTKNAEVLDNLSSQLRQRVYTVRYEDIVEDPLQMAEYLYNFVGLDYSDDIRHYVYNITLGGSVQQCAVCNMKWQKGRKLDESVTSHLTAWKNRATVGELVDIQNHCEDVLNYYGYKVYDIDD